MENREQYFKVVRRCGLAMVLGLVAIPLLLCRDWIANQFATSYSLTIDLTIQDRSYRPRLQRAVDAARVPDGVTASFSFDPNMWSGSHIEVVAPSREAAVAAARSLGDFLAREYDAAGETRLDVRVPRRAYPDDNSTTASVRAGLAIGARLLELLAVGLFAITWRWGRANGALTARKGTGYVVAVLWGVPVAVVMTGPLFMVLLAMAIPTAIAAAIILKMQEVRRASRWPSVQGRIESSRTRRKKTQRGDDPARIGNLPDITYVYTVDGVEHRSKRIGIGEIKPGSPEAAAALERYQVGRTGPVFYNPDNPKEAVLERNPPARPAVMYACAGSVMVIGAVVVFGFTRASEIIEWLQP